MVCPRESGTTLLAAIGASALLLAAGCGGGEDWQSAEVTGTVTLDGRPIPEGHITFLPSGDTRGPSATTTITDGRYAMIEGGPVVGTHRVEIRTPVKTGRKIPDLRPENRMKPDRPMIDEVVEAIPVTYNTKSTLTVEIRPGKNEMSFDLKGGGS